MFSPFLKITNYFPFCLYTENLRRRRRSRRPLRRSPAAAATPAALHAAAAAPTASTAAEPLRGAIQLQAPPAGRARTKVSERIPR